MEGDLVDIHRGFAMGGSTAQPAASSRNTRKRLALESSINMIPRYHQESKERTKVLNDEEEGVGDKQKRLLAHREIERQRRQDMAKLYSSLRNLLPLEFIRAKRAISDHMHQAVNYIQYMQQNIQQLNVKRDELKKTTCNGDIMGSGNHTIGSWTNRVQNTVMVTSSLAGGVEILINSGFVKEGFPISRVLRVLSEGGLEVISCTSTKVNGRLFHTIQSDQVGDDLMCANHSALQQKLRNVVNNW